MSTRLTNRVLSFAMALIMVLGTINITTPITVHAAMPINTIGQPYDGVDFNELSAQDNHIYYGSFDHAKTLLSGTHGTVTAREGNLTPILWKIMGEEADAGVGDGNITLISEHVIDSRPIDSSSHDWDGSMIKAWLNNTFLTNSFLGSEIDGINAPTTLNIKDMSGGAINNVTPSKVWLLATNSWNANDVTWYSNMNNSPLGTLGGTSKNISTLKNGVAAHWWLRTNISDISRMVIMGTGGTNDIADFSFDVGIRPAFKLNPSSVIFASEILASGNTSKGETVANSNYLAATGGFKNFKLTVLDSSLSSGTLTANTQTVDGSTHPVISVLPGGTIDVDGNGTASTNLTYKIVDSNRNIVGYGQSPDNQSLAVLTKNLAGANLVDGDYTVYVWAQKNETINSNTGSMPEYFTMTVANDNTAPLVTSVTPADNATGVPINGNIEIIFDEAITTTGIVSLDNGTTTLIGGSFDATKKVYTIPYSGLAYSTEYTIAVEGFKDFADNEMTPNNSYKFTTRAIPQAPNVDPTTLDITTGESKTFTVSLGEIGNEANQATVTSVNTGIATVTYNPNPIVASDTVVTVTGVSQGTTTINVNFSGGLYNSGDGGTKTISVTVTDSEHTVTFNTNGGTRTGGGLLTQIVSHGTSATAPILTRTNYNFDGWDKSFDNVTEAMTVTAQWSDNTPPTVTSIIPADDATGIAINGNIKITFNEEMATIGTVSLDNGTTTLNSGSFDATDKVFTIAYSGIAYSTNYTISIEGFKDVSGNEMTPNNSYKFTTRAIPQAPNVDPTTLDITTGESKTFTVSLGEIGNDANQATVTSVNTGIATVTYNPNPIVASDTVVTVTGISQGTTTINVNFSGGLYNSGAGGTKTVSVTVTDSEHTVTFNPNGGTRTGGGLLTQIVSHGTSATAPTVSKSNYTFMGWNKTFDTVTDNMIITAQWIDNTAPTITSVTPEDNAISVPINGNIEITFDEEIATTGTVSLDNGTTTLSGGSLDATQKVFTIAYSDLAYSTDYTISVEGFKDFADNEMTDNSSYKFTTRAIPDGPDVDPLFLDIIQGHSNAFTVSLGQSGNEAHEATATSMDTDVATISYNPQTIVTSGSAITVTGIQVGSTTINVNFFGGTYNNGNGGTKTVNVTVIEPQEITHTVTFDPNGGIHIGGGQLTQTVSHGSAATMPYVTQSNYTFNGWDKSFDNVTDDMTITAQWGYDEDYFTDGDGSFAPPPIFLGFPVSVTFDPNGGTHTGGGQLSQTIPQGTDATAPIVTRINYTFLGWDKSFDNVNTNMTVIAQWSYDEKYPIDGDGSFAPPQMPVSVTFDPNGGTHTGGGQLSQTIPQGTAATAPTITRSNYTFVGWDKSFHNVTSNITIKALWSYNSDDSGSSSGSSSSNSSGNSSSSSSGSSSGNSSSSSNSNINNNSSNNSNASSSIISLDKQPNMPTVSKGIIDGTLKDNVLTTIITEKMAQEAIKAAQGAGMNLNGIAVEFENRSIGNYESFIAKFEHEAIERLNEADVKYIQIRSKIIDISLDAQAITEIKSETRGIVTVAAKRETKLSDPAKTAIGTRPAYEITIKDSYGKLLSDLKSGTLTIGIAYKTAYNENSSNLDGVFVKQNGHINWLRNLSYDSNKVMFKFSSLSVYGIGYVKPAPYFNDTKDHWAKNDIDFVVNHELIDGTNNSFSPETAITRSDFLMALVKLSGANVSSYNMNSFTDISSTSAEMPYIEWAVQNKIVQGIGNNQFAPDKKITREQMAVMMDNYTKTTNYMLPIYFQHKEFEDENMISLWASEAVKNIQQAGIVNGKDNNLFDPTGDTTRAEASAILKRFVELIIEKGIARGWVKNTSGQWQYINTYGNGVMGWLSISDNDKYYFDENSVMVYNKWMKIDSKWYYFDADGRLMVNTK